MGKLGVVTPRGVEPDTRGEDFTRVLQMWEMWEMWEKNNRKQIGSSWKQKSCSTSPRGTTGSTF